MRFLKTSEAATLLNVSPNTLRAWERRFGFPKPQRSPGQHRLYTYGEVAGLRDALQDGLSISSAVSRAREGLATDGNTLGGALSAFEGERAEMAIEAALSLRSVERTVEEVLLPTLDGIAKRHGTDSAAWAFAARWGSEWLRRAQRLAPPPARPGAIVVGDASRDELDPDAVHIRALELLCVRAGIRVLGLSARGVVGIGEAVTVHAPDLAILAGGHLGDDDVARWAYAVRLATGALPVLVFRRGDTRARGRGSERTQLPSSATDAQRRIMELVESARSGAERRALETRALVRQAG